MGELLTARTTAFLKTTDSIITEERIRNIINRLDDAYITMGYNGRPEDNYSRERCLTRMRNLSDCPDDKMKLNVEIFRLVRKVSDCHSIQNQLTVGYDDWAGMFEDMLSICILHDLRPSTVNPMQLSYIPDVMSEGRERRVRGKPAKIIRKLFSLTDEQVEEFFRLYNGYYNPIAFTLRHGCTAADFKFAYATDDDFVGETDIIHANLDSGNSSKALSNSCMRYWGINVGRYWQEEGMHPAEIFATKSEYMHIAYAVDANNKVASRSCYSPTDNVCSSIYGTSMKSVYIIDDFFKEQGYRPSLHGSSWPNFQVRRVEYSNDSNTLHMPYLDMDIRHFDEKGSLLVIGNDFRGGSSTLGKMEIFEGYECDSCGHSVDVDDVTYNDCGNGYCEDCYNAEYTRCAIDGDELLLEDAIEIDHCRFASTGGVSNVHQGPNDLRVRSDFYRVTNVGEHAYEVCGDWYSRLFPLMLVHHRPDHMFVEPVTLHQCIRKERGGTWRALLPDETRRMMDVLYQDQHDYAPTIDFEDYGYECSSIQVPCLVRNGNSQRVRANVLIMIEADANLDDLIKSLSEQIKNELGDE